MFDLSRKMMGQLEIMVTALPFYLTHPPPLPPISFSDPVRFGWVERSRPMVGKEGPLFQRCVQTTSAIAILSMTEGMRLSIIEQFSNDCRKTKTKAITPTNHDRGKQRDEPITIPSNYM